MLYINNVNVMINKNIKVKHYLNVGGEGNYSIILR